MVASSDSILASNLKLILYFTAGNNQLRWEQTENTIETCIKSLGNKRKTSCATFLYYFSPGLLSVYIARIAYIFLTETLAVCYFSPSPVYCFGFLSLHCTNILYSFRETHTSTISSVTINVPIDFLKVFYTISSSSKLYIFVAPLISLFWNEMLHARNCVKWATSDFIN